jgi:hypothetical protein
MEEVMLHGKETRRIVLALFSAASLGASGGVAQAQQPTAGDFIAEADYCSFTGLCGNGGQSQVTTTHLGVDPCYLAQNAMRPCTSEDMKALQPHGVDPNLVGTWELPLKGGLWVLSIDAKGNYTFHSEAQDGVPPHAGSFAASNGAWRMTAKSGSAFAGGGSYKFHSEATDGAPSHAGMFIASANQWTLTATSGIPFYTDNGQYLYQAPNIWMVKGKLGGAAWIRRCNP